MNKMPIQVAIAILCQLSQESKENHFLLQLRDDIPGILYPGHWGFFGGHLEPEEPPEIAVKRELWEEIGHVPPTLSLFKRYSDGKVIRHVFYAPLTVGIDALELNEGWDMGLFTVDDVYRGDRYSERAGRVCPLGAPHQQILLDFLKQDGGAIS